MPLEQHKPRLTPAIRETDHVTGPSDAPLTLVEYGDYECPYCKNMHPIIRRLLAEMPGQIRFIFRHFPMNSVHPKASVAAQAAEAAGAQGKFWEMHDLLYENQQNLAEMNLDLLALKAGLEIYRFEADVSGETYARRVREDFSTGVKSGVNGTPTLFINQERYDGPQEYEALKGAIDHALGHTKQPD